MSVNWKDKIDAVQTREDFADFVLALSRDNVTFPDDWENNTLDRYLFALCRWVDGMDGYFKNIGEEVPTEPSWKFMAIALYAAKIYE